MSEPTRAADGLPSITTLSESKVPKFCKEYRAYEIVDVRDLGRGGFGVVKLVLIDGRPVAAKMLNPTGAHELKIARGLLLKEVRAMAELPHENIVRLFGVCLDPGKMCILMEHMQRGSLRQREGWQSGQRQSPSGMLASGGARHSM